MDISSIFPTTTIIIIAGSNKYPKELTHFRPMFPLVISGGIKWDHRPEVGQRENLEIKSCF